MMVRAGTAGSRFTTRRGVCAVLLAAVCSVAGLGISGCGASNTVDPVAQAATTSTGAPGFKMNFTVSVSSPALPQPVTGTGTGAFDTKDRSGSLGLDMNLGNSPQIVQALGGSTLRLDEIISNGTTLYMKFPPALTNKLPGHKPWIKFDVAKAAAASGIPGIASLANNPGSTDPSQLLQYLRAVSGNVSNEGSETIGGIQTTHYRATVDLDKVPNVVPAAQRQAAKQAIQALQSKENVHQLPIDAWIDGQHLVRQLKMTFSFSSAGQPLSATTTIDIPEYAAQPAPTLPSPDQVTDLNGLLGAAG
jgi:hypothetical protein